MSYLCISSITIPNPGLREYRAFGIIKPAGSSLGGINGGDYLEMWSKEHGESVVWNRAKGDEPGGSRRPRYVP